MKRLGSAILGMAAALALTTSASAAVVCNEDGDCWRTSERLTYPPDARVNIYDDDFAIDAKKYRLREAGKGRGYYRGGVWIGF